MKNHGRDNTGFKFNKWLDFLSDKNIGELAVYSVDNDGTNKGYDENLINIINKNKTPINLWWCLSNINNISSLIKKQIPQVYL